MAAASAAETAEGRPELVRDGAALAVTRRGLNVGGAAALAGLPPDDVRAAVDER